MDRVHAAQVLVRLDGLCGLRRPGCRSREIFSDSRPLARKGTRQPEDPGSARRRHADHPISLPGASSPSPCHGDSDALLLTQPDLYLSSRAHPHPDARPDIALTHHIIALAHPDDNEYHYGDSDSHYHRNEQWHKHTTSASSVRNYALTPGWSGPGCSGSAKTRSAAGSGLSDSMRSRRGSDGSDGTGRTVTCAPWSGRSVRCPSNTAR